MNLTPLLKHWQSDPVFIEFALASLIAEGHLLIEGPPGVGKTHLSSLIAKGFDLHTLKVQGTPDLMPADIVGTYILGHNRNKVFHQGPIFCQLLQIDEINRIAPRTLSAVLEAMQEYQVSLMEKSFELPRPFHVIATRNTREFEGVYPLPESALDRFIISLRISLPEEIDEKSLLKETSHPQPNITGTLGSLKEHQSKVKKIQISDRLIKRIIDLIQLSRQDSQILLGAGVRATQALTNISKALAYIRGMNHVTLDIIEEAALPALAHRVTPKYTLTSTKSFIDDYWKQSDPVYQLKKRFEGILL